jgi:type VI secretion system protein ImpG
MQDIVHNYEQELAAFRRSMAEFATRFPKIAARLAISGEQVEDIHVERLMQSAALLNARIQARLGDS